MELYTLILVTDDRSPVRRMHVPKVTVKRAAAAAAVALLLLAGGLWDYWRLRSENRDLPGLRAETTAQADQMRVFEQTLAGLEAEIARVRELERKVRIIANLPGATAVGGVEVTDLAPATAEGDELLALPAGVPLDWSGRGGSEPGERPLSQEEGGAESAAPAQAGVARLEELGGDAIDLRRSAAGRAGLLDELLEQLEDKRNRLASMPSIWPTRGWLTSRYGARISPFTARRQMHGGIDIATREGTAIVAPAHARVVFVGSKGPLGKSISLDHGFGVRTVYGHTQRIHVKTGDEVERGDLIATVGNTGRSTGPHLHYAVLVKGKARDPLDYIFD